MTRCAWELSSTRTCGYAALGGELCVYHRKLRAGMLSDSAGAMYGRYAPPGLKDDVLQRASRRDLYEVERFVGEAEREARERGVPLAETTLGMIEEARTTPAGSSPNGGEGSPRRAGPPSGDLADSAREKPGGVQKV